jgi:outer membrane biosynthesis protein TonB
VAPPPPVALAPIPARSRDARRKTADDLLAGGAAALDAPLDAGPVPGVVVDHGSPVTVVGAVQITHSESTPVAGVDRVLASVRGRWRACYTRALMQDPGMTGTLQLAISVQGDGTVAKIDVTGGDGLSSSLSSCVASVTRNAKFSPPEGGMATVTVRVLFSATK